MKSSNAIYDNNGKVVGKIEAGWIEKVNIDPAKHKLRSPEGYATDAVHISKLINGTNASTALCWKLTLKTSTNTRRISTGDTETNLSYR